MSKLLVWAAHCCDAGGCWVPKPGESTVQCLWGKNITTDLALETCWGGTGSLLDQLLPLSPFLKLNWAKADQEKEWTTQGHFSLIIIKWFDLETLLVNGLYPGFVLEGTSFQGSQAFISLSRYLFIYFLNSWASDRQGEQKCWVSFMCSATNGRHLLIFDWKPQFFNESKRVAWKRIVLSTNTLIQEQAPVANGPWALLIEKHTLSVFIFQNKWLQMSYFLSFLFFLQ